MSDDTRPIIYTGWGVQRILANEKTQTRRPIKPQPANPKWTGKTWIDSGYDDTRHYEIKCPYGKPGDFLYVKENWAENIPGCPNGLTYRADHIDPKGDGPANPIKWKSSRFMPRRVARIFLRIKDIRVERLQDISEKDVFAEGVQIPVNNGTPLLRLTGDSKNPAPAQYLKKGYSNTEFIRAHFAALWDSIYAKTFSWESNPYVWAIDFIKEERT